MRTLDDNVSTTTVQWANIAIIASDREEVGQIHRTVAELWAFKSQVTGFQVTRTSTE